LYNIVGLIGFGVVVVVVFGGLLFTSELWSGFDD